MSKKSVILLTVLAVAIGVTLAVVFMPDSGPQGAANKFFFLIRSDRLQKAYDNYTSETVRGGVSFEAFQNSMGPLKNYRRLSWDSVVIEENTAALLGLLTNVSGADFVVDANLMLENEQWKVYFANYRLKPVEASSMPSEPKLKKLVVDSMISFVDAVAAEDFTDFYDTTAGLWRNQITTDELKEAFKQLLPLKDILTFVKTAEPIIDISTTKIENSILIIAGYYESETAVLFELGYILEAGRWKLMNISVKIAGQ